MEQLLMRNAQRWVAPQRAWLEAREGTLWVTRAGDVDDHVLPRGERLAVARGDDLVLQSWHRDEPALWDWQPLAAPAGYGLRREVLAWAWARAARALRGARIAAPGRRRGRRPGARHGAARGLRGRRRG